MVVFHCCGNGIHQNGFSDYQEIRIVLKYKMTETCDCPFCPLVEMNMQVCNVIVKLPTGKKYVDLADTVRGDFSVQAKLNILKIVLFARNNKKLKVKDSIGLTGTGNCHCNVERISQQVFKFCFHAKEAEAP
jgi:hypothetical protein